VAASGQGATGGAASLEIMATTHARPGAAAGAVGYPEHLRALVEDYLTNLRFAREPGAAGLEEAMRYSLLAGGKRIRPVLALATARAIGATRARSSRSPPHSS
jgi:hypothetical protein